IIICASVIVFVCLSFTILFTSDDYRVMAVTPQFIVHRPSSIVRQTTSGNRDRKCLQLSWLLVPWSRCYRAGSTASSVGHTALPVRHIGNRRLLPWKQAALSTYRMGGR